MFLRTFLKQKSPFWSIPFRPFFSFAVLYAVFLIPMWILYLAGVGTYYLRTSPLTPYQWHAHEMIFGFIEAVLLGFLLTASAKWSNTKPINGMLLQFMTLLFLLTRLVFWVFPFQKIWMYQVIGVLPILWVVLHLGVLFIKHKMLRQFILIFSLCLLMVSEIFLLDPENYEIGRQIALGALALVFTIIIGRILPYFTQRALNIEVKRQKPVLENFLIFIMFALVFVSFYSSYGLFGKLLQGSLFLLATGLHVKRLLLWEFVKARKIPILFILYIGYSWMPIYYSLEFIRLFINDLLSSTVYHALFVGAFGTIIFAMIHRVTLGHTGREIRSNKKMTISYSIFFISTLFRVFGPIFSPEKNLMWLHISTTTWSLSFAILAWETLPMFFSQRVDKN